MMNSPHLPLPEKMPVMAPRGVTLFPNALVPLYIFEPRYRAMLASVLAGDRIFAVGMVRPDTGEENIFPVAGAGLVRACVEQPDGTSQLILQGVGRVRFDTFAQTEPFLIGHTSPVETTDDQPETCQQLHREMQDFCVSLVSRGVELPEAFIKAAGETEDSALLGDLLAQHLVRDPLSAQEVLTENRLARRLQSLLKILRREWQQFDG